MDRNFERALSLVLKHEGGWSDHPQDKGGPTMKGVTLASYSGPMSDRFARAIVNYPAPFSKPPIVLFAGITGAAETDQLLSSVLSGSGSANWTLASVASYTDRFEMYGYYRRVDGSLYPRTTMTYRYFVFHNTIDGA